LVGYASARAKKAKPGQLKDRVEEERVTV